LDKTYYYTGKEIKPTVTVYDRKGNVIDNSNYTVRYENNKYAGTADVYVYFDGKYDGTLTTTFTIKGKAPKKASITSLKAYGKGFTITIKDSDKSVVGYQVQYSKTKDFKKAKSFYVTKDCAKTGKVGLAKSTKYYVRVRAFSTIPNPNSYHFTFDLMNGTSTEEMGTTKVYGKWSTVKSVKTSSKNASSPILKTVLFDKNNYPFFYYSSNDSKSEGKLYKSLRKLATACQDAKGKGCGMTTCLPKSGKYRICYDAGAVKPSDVGIVVY
jgi:hypothetical protein